MMVGTMKISVFTSMTDPESRNDPYQEAIQCYEELGDELIIVGERWPKEFSFDLANSGKGQHIHFIVNNGPYSAYYSN